METINITEGKFQHDYVLIEPISQFEGDVLVKPEHFEDKPTLGKVISRGCGRKLENGELIKAEEIKEGSIVLFGKYSTESIRYEGKDYFIIRIEDIKAVF